MKKNGTCNKKPKNYRDGGNITGKGTGTSDSILARVSNGEYVLPEESVDLVGVDTLNAIRDAGLAQRYANGGLVGPMGQGMMPKTRQGLTARNLAGMSADSLGVGPGLVGFAKGMTHSDPAQAAVMDVTRTREYQDALRGSRGAGGNTPTPGLLGMTAGPWAGETPNETLARLHQTQAQTDAMVRQMTGSPTPTEARMLGEANRFNPRAYRGYADGGLVGSGYGSYIDENQRRQLNDQLGKDFDASLKSATDGATPTMSTAYGVGAVTPPAPKPQSALSSSVPATPGNEWGSLNDKWGIERPNASSLPPPPNSWTSGQQQSTTTTPQTQQPYTLQSMQPPPRFQAPQGKGYQQLPGSDYFARSQTLQPGSLGYQDAQRQRLGGGLGSFAGGSEPLYERSYMGPAGTAVGISSVAPGRGSLSVADQGNGGTVEGNVAAINRQIAALQDLNQARLDDPVNGRFSFGEGTKNPFSLPGDSFQDSRARAAQFDQLVKDASSGTRGERQSAAKGLQSLMGLMQGNQQQALGLAQVFQNQQESRASALARQLLLQQQAMADAQKYGLDLGRFGLSLQQEQRAADNDISKASQPTTTQLQAQLISRMEEARVKGDANTYQSLLDVYRNYGFAKPQDQILMPPA